MKADNPSYFLKANIPEGDKSILFDGEIQVFKDASETVESLIGSVPVQVKGKHKCTLNSLIKNNKNHMSNIQFSIYTKKG